MIFYLNATKYLNIEKSGYIIMNDETKKKLSFLV